MENVILYLIGYPGTGKLTIGREIASDEENTHLIDNHKTTNLIFPFVERTKDLSDHPMWIYIREIRDVVYRFVANEADSHLNFIFTNFLLHQERDIRVYDKVMGVAEKRNATFIPVKLTCDVEVIKERITSEASHRFF